MPTIPRFFGASSAQARLGGSIANKKATVCLTKNPCPTNLLLKVMVLIPYLKMLVGLFLSALRQASANITLDGKKKVRPIPMQHRLALSPEGICNLVQYKIIKSVSG